MGVADLPQALPAQTDVLLVGAGVMSATLGTLIQLLAPHLHITMVESLAEPAAESSDAWNNAGTGHAALCELNYTPELPDGTVAIDRAVKINEQFLQSRQFWAALVERGELDPSAFIHAMPHMSFVSGAADVDFLRRRYTAMQASPLFAGTVFSDDPDQIRAWIPLMMRDRAPGEPLACTRSLAGTDLDFGALTRMLLRRIVTHGGQCCYGYRLMDLNQLPDGRWYTLIENRQSGERTRLTARFVFLGAGGGALPLLQRSGISEGRGYGGFPVSGQWLRCTNRDVIAQHAAKVYGKPALGAPPMSVPHLDTRMIGGQRELLFGPFAGFSTRFLKKGSFADLPRSIGTGNLVSMLGAGASNLPLTRYLIGQVMQSADDRVAALRDFVPTARKADWKLEIAGQRVQIIKSDPHRGGKLEFGTEMIRSADGSLAALLGASPGASTAVSVMLDLLDRGLSVLQSNADTLRSVVSTYGFAVNRQPDLAASLMASTAQSLQLDRTLPTLPGEASGASA